MAARDDFALVCFSHLRWGFVHQRPQHLLSRAARERRVVFVEEPVFDASVARLAVEDMDGISAVVPHLPPALAEDVETAEQTQRRLLERLIDDLGLDRYVVWFFTPMAVPIARALEPLATVYDCMDELSAFALAPLAVRDREGELYDSADLVFTGGRSLYEARRDRHPHVHLFPSSVDAEHFGRAREALPEPPDQAAIPHPRIGFFGVIDERTDRDLLREVARRRPDWNLVLVGPVLKIDPATLPSLPNIHLLGKKGYDELPSYIAGWDVAMLPFALNEHTRFISPTKTPEYLAAGRPVVSTPIADVVRDYAERGVVEIARTPDEFVEATERAMSIERQSFLDRVDELLSDTSWDRTWAGMRTLISDVVATRGAAAARAPESAVVDVSDARPPRVETSPRGFDYVIVGAGFAGSVLAERLASVAHRKVLVVERRAHIGGNAYDEYDDAGILVHRYGPHIFHTNAARVFEYLSAFTEWRPYEHRVLASVDGQLVPIPINLDTVNLLYGTSFDSFEMQEFLKSVAEPVEFARTSEEAVLGAVGRDLYEKFFRNYTRKQWGMDPAELDASVAARVPARTNRDDRYFTDTFQAMPLHGYTRMFQRILSHPNIKLMLNTDFRDIADVIPYGDLIYTGAIDEFFGFSLGRLPYRSLQFRFETKDVPVYQQAPVVNFPNEHAYTRTTEFKYLTGQRHPQSTIVYEYPRADGDPYYPVPRPDNRALFARYRGLAEETPGVHFAGRLATYRYYNMDQVVAQALAVFERLERVPRFGKESTDAVADAIVSPTRGLGRDRVHP